MRLQAPTQHTQSLDSHWINRCGSYTHITDAAANERFIPAIESSCCWVGGEQPLTHTPNNPSTAPLGLSGLSWSRVMGCEGWLTSTLPPSLPSPTPMAVTGSRSTPKGRCRECGGCIRIPWTNLPPVAPINRMGELRDGLSAG